MLWRWISHPQGEMEGNTIIPQPVRGIQNIRHMVLWALFKETSHFSQITNPPKSKGGGDSPVNPYLGYRASFHRPERYTSWSLWSHHCKAQSAGLTKTQAVLWWSLKSPWWMKLHFVTYTFWISYWLHEGSACGSLICRYWGWPLISHLSKTEETPLPDESKLNGVPFFCSIRPNPQKPQWESSLPHETILMKKNFSWCQQPPCTMESHTTSQASLLHALHTDIGTNTYFLSQKILTLRAQRDKEYQNFSWKMGPLPTLHEWQTY